MDEELRTYLEGMEKRLIERIDTTRTELLGHSEGLAAGQNVRLRKLEEDRSTSEYIAQKRRCP